MCASCLKARSHLDHQEYIVAYGSHKFDETEERWNIVEKEAHIILFGVKKFHHYLFGKSFLLRTDSWINTYLQFKCAPKNRKLLNWVLELSEYNYEVQHIRFKNNGISHCLSSLHCINVLLSSLKPELNHDDLKSLQSDYPELFAAMNYLALAHRHFDVNFLGSLKHHQKQLSLSPDGLLLWKKLVVVPSQLHSTVLRLSHDHPYSRHFSIDCTWSRLSAHYFWPNAKQDVTNWVQSCLACDAHNPPPKGYHTDPLQPIYSSERFELVCYDLAGPFMPSSSRGNTYALILVDHFTKWPEVVPLPDSKASTIAHSIYDHWIC